MNLPWTSRAGAVVATALFLAACGGGSDTATSTGTTGGTTGVALSGVVTAPGGTIAFNTPTFVDRMLALFTGAPAVAGLPDTAAVSGASVKLIEIDNTGAQVGADIATGTSGSDGSFTLTAPADFVPGPRYVIRATGTATMDALVTGNTGQDVDPASHVAKELIVASAAASGTAMANLIKEQVEEFRNGIAAQVREVDASNTGSMSTLVTALSSGTQDDEEAAHVLANLTAAGRITGTVTDSAGAPLANIKIVVRDYKNWVTRAVARTNVNGQYTLAVAADNYIIGALNFTGASMGASEWYTAGGGTAHMFAADKVAVVGATPITRNFTLEPGARITGSIMADGTTTPLPGVQIAVRDFTADMPAGFTRTQPDGSFRMNVRPGTYTLGARNSTRQAYAGGLYNGPAAGGSTTGGGGSDATAATPMALTAGSTYNVNFGLVAGAAIQGQVTDGTNPVPGMSVRFYRTTGTDTSGAFVEALRTNKQGLYRLWVQPGDYAVRARGQSAVRAGLLAGTATPTPFTSGTVGSATATLCAPGTGTNTGTACSPVARSKVQVYDNASAYVGFEASDGDGSVVAYVPAANANYRFEYKIDNGSTSVGTSIESGGVATLIALPSSVATTVGQSTAFGERTLLAGGELKGIVTVGGVATGNIVVQVRTGGLAGTNRLTATRTQSDGSYSISVPAATYARVCAFPAGGSCPNTGSGSGSSAGAYAFVDNVAVTANQSKVQDFVIP